MRDWDRRGLFVIGAAHGTSDFYAAMVPLIVYYFATRHGYSAVFQGAAGFVWYVTSSIVQPLFGAYSDRHGQWWYLPASIGLTAIGVSLAALAHDPALLILLIVVGGLGSALMHPEAGRYAAMLSGSRKAGGISIFMNGGQIGYALAPAVAAFVLARFGGGGMVWLVIPGLFAIAAIFWAMRRIAPRAERRHQEEAPLSEGRARVDRGGIGLLVGSSALSQLVLSSFMLFLPNLLVARGFSLVEAGWVVSLFLLVALFGTYWGGSLADRFGALLVSIASLVAAVPLLVVFVVFSGPLALGALVLGSVLRAMSSGPAVALVQAMLPRNLGMALGLMNGVAFGIGSALATGVGVVVARAGPATALTLVSCVPLVSALAYLEIGRRLGQVGLRGLHVGRAR
ncbi:MAG: MFS transporter [Candidatus Eremiobacteraeota bacterium]|nr:MFS transporter [Candidatus Eremiobacteraeota bacterium]